MISFSVPKPYIGYLVATLAILCPAILRDIYTDISQYVFGGIAIYGHPKTLSTEAWDPEQYRNRCPKHEYMTRILSYTPLLISIAHFATPEEGAYLISLG